MGKFLFRLRLFSQKRYGVDALYWALMLIFFITMVLFFALSGLGSRIFFVLSCVVFIVAFFRVFSTNIEGRSRENQAFLRLLGKAGSANVTNPFENMSFGNVGNSEPDKKYVKCPKCKATLRVPRQKGKHTVRCPRCDHRFKSLFRILKKKKKESIIREKEKR